MKGLFKSQNQKQEKPEPPSASTGIQRETSASSLMMETGTPSAVRLLRSLSECPIVVFKKALCTGDLSLLIVSGEPSDAQLLEAWNEIYFDYAAVLKSDSSDYTFNMAKDIGLLKQHIAYVEWAVLFLRLKYVPEVVEELQAIGYFDLEYSEDPAEWERRLNRVISLAKTKVHDLENLERDYERLNKTSEGKSVTEEEFNQTVLELARFQGYRIDQVSTMMDEYVSIYNNFLRDIKIKSKHHGGEKN